MKKKVVAAIMSVALVAAVGIGGTLAYLSAQSEVVNNTFTVGTGFVPDEDGNKGIVLDEAKVMDDGTVDATQRVDGNQTYPELMPGDSKLKDPTVRFVAGSVESYVFVKVEGTQKAEGNYLTVDGWNTQIWQKVADLDGEPFGTTGDGYYMYVGPLADENHVVDLDTEEYEEGTDVELGYIFNSISFDNVGNEEFDQVSPGFNDTAIKVSACAVQAGEGTTWEDGFAEATFK